MYTSRSGTLKGQKQKQKRPALLEADSIGNGLDDSQGMHSLSICAPEKIECCQRDGPLIVTQFLTVVYLIETMQKSRRGIEKGMWQPFKVAYTSYISAFAKLDIKTFRSGGPPTSSRLSESHLGI